MKITSPRLLRCAIYTRKSTEHNLDLAFTSLDAQREACEAYIRSQASEGWRLVPGRYDYGGLSGVVHAGVAAIVVWALANGRTRAQRWVGALVALGFIAKLVSETPWGAPLRQPAGWDIAVAPFVHLTGAISGALCALVALFFQRRFKRRVERAQDSLTP